jgi:uncharacterized protein with HEPN domain
MDSVQRSIDILKKIVVYCNQLGATKARFGQTFEDLTKDQDYRNSAAMCILQIGELATHLSPQFRKEHGAIPWQDIIGMRNIAAHHYGEFRLHYLWDTMNEDISPLRDYCNQCIYELSAQSSNEQDKTD